MAMSYNKKDVLDIATKLGRLVNGGVIGYYAGGKTSEIMSQTIPERLLDVVERHKKIQLGASLAQSFVPGAGVAAMTAATISLWKMYYDINSVIGIKISENAGKSLASAVLTNFGSFGVQGVATAVSEGVKFIPFVGWMASAGISTVTTTAIIYGAAYVYLKALTTMYEAEGKLDLNYLSSLLTNNNEQDDEDDDEQEGVVPLSRSTVNRIKQIIASWLDDFAVEDIVSTKDLEDDLGIDDEIKKDIIDELEEEFDVELSRDVSDYTFVDDFIEAVTGESIWDCDNDYEGDEVIDNNDNDTLDRFESFYESYVKGEYEDMKMVKLANMFENEAENCPSEGIKSQYYCMAAVVRMEFYIKEWLDNSFENWPKEENELNELLMNSISAGLDDIQKSREILPDDKEYLLIYEILSMLKYFFIDCEDDKDKFIGTYGNAVDEYRDFEDSMFNTEWLIGLFNRVYDAILMGLDLNESN